MTFLQPKKRAKVLSILLVGLVVSTAASAFALISFYNRVVDFDHKIAEVDARIQEAETASAELKEHTLAPFTEEHFAYLVRERGLIRERAPEYLETDTQWEFASHF